MSDRDEQRLERLAGMEPLADTLADRDAGDLFSRDLEEARALAERDPRFEPLVRGLSEPALGARMRAVDRFFASLPSAELATLPLPPSLAQLRQIYLSSRPGEA